MDDLISRQAAIDALGDMVMNWTDSEYELGQLNQWKEDRKAIIDLPSAQPKRKTGKWIYKNDLKQFFCDQCGEPSLTDDDVYIYDMYFPNFCPNCGANMRGEQE